MKAEQALTFVEIDVPYCALRYGEGTCTAVLGVDSQAKCFNTFATCAKREVFDEGTVTLRFAMDTAYIHDSNIAAIPSIDDVRYDPAVLSLGEKSLGVRAKLAVTFVDHPYGDTGVGFDKYRSERNYDPAKQGSFWGKFRARHPVLKGRAIRLIRGVVGQPIEEMETRHLIVDAIDTDAQGRFTITGKDILKLADGDRALAPRPSAGFLVADITAAATSAQLGPSGIGNKEYPGSGQIAIGGREIASFTRSGDVLTLTRGQFGTTAAAHQAQDRVQLCLYYQGEDPADIIADLLIGYANVPSDQIPIGDWKEETATYLRRVYTSLIAEPTPVRDLVAELVEQAALVLIPDDIAKLIRLQVLRTIATDAALWSEANIGKDKLAIRDQPDKRITNCVTYYGLINPLENVDDPKNYRSIEVYDATDFDVEDQPTIKRIYSRWIPAFGRTVAERLNLIQIGRYGSAPRRFTFDVFRDRDPRLGTGYRISYWPMQLPTGERESVPMQITSLRPGDAWFGIEGEEVRFIDLDEQDLTNRIVIIDGSAFNLNPSSLSLLDALSDSDIRGANQVEVRDGYAHVVCNTSVGGYSYGVVDISDPSAISTVATILGEFYEPSGLQLVGDYSYVGNNKLDGDGTGEVTVIDISDPTTPEIVQRVKLNAAEGGHQLVIRDGYMFLTAGKSALESFLSFRMGGSSGRGLIFSGTGAVDTGITSLPSASSFTVFARMYVNRRGGVNRRLISKDVVGSTGQFFIELVTATTLRVLLRNFGDTFWTDVTYDLGTNHKWVTLALVWDAPERKLRLYVDGELVATADGPTETKAISEPLVIGGDSNGTDNLWDGWIDEVRFMRGVATYPVIRTAHFNLASPATFSRVEPDARLKRWDGEQWVAVQVLDQYDGDGWVRAG